MSDPDHAKRVLVIHYSQSGQLSRVLESVVKPLQASTNITVDFLNIQPRKSYPFPWPFLTFINAFPESIYDKGCELETIDASQYSDYDLVILGYQVWYLSPSIPVTAFLQSAAAEKILSAKPVITVIACRNMWLMAQERVKAHLDRLGARLIGNVALTDEAGAGLSFFATPLWVLTGNKGPFPFGIPKAGVADDVIARADRFGQAILDRFNHQQPLDESILKGLGSVAINVNLIASEKIATRSFRLWGKLFLLLGRPESLQRKILAVLYAVFLVTMIVTVIPLNALVKRLLKPFSQKRNESLRKYYSLPSGEAINGID